MQVNFGKANESVSFDAFDSVVSSGERYRIRLQVSQENDLELALRGQSMDDEPAATWPIDKI